MAEIIRRQFKSFFRLERGRAVSLGEEQPENLEQGASGFALIIEAGGTNRARLIEADNIERAEAIAQQNALRQQRGARIKVGEVVGEKNGDLIFKDISGFIVNG